MRARGSLQVRELTEEQRNEILTLAVERVYDYLRDRLGPGALQCVEVKAEITRCLIAGAKEVSVRMKDENTVEVTMQVSLSDVWDVIRRHARLLGK